MPLAEPLALPDHSILEFYDYPSYDDWVASMEADRHLSLDVPWRFTSLRFWQTTVQDTDPFGLNAVFDVAMRAFPDLPEPTDPEPYPLPRTVVEAAVQLTPFNGESPGEDVLSEAFDDARPFDIAGGLGGELLGGPWGGLGPLTHRPTLGHPSRGDPLPSHTCDQPTTPLGHHV